MEKKEELKERFEKIFQENISREGKDALLTWLRKSDFFVAPASTKYHGACEGGLCEHSLNVYTRLLSLVEGENKSQKPLSKELLEKVTTVSLLHDLCKVNFYKVSSRNVKNEETGKWEKVPYYVVDEKLPYGHGEKSVFLIERFMRLKIDEAMAIRWHMGGFDTAVKGGSYAIGEAWNAYPIAIQLHVADLQATYIDERKEG